MTQLEREHKEALVRAYALTHTNREITEHFRFYSMQHTYVYLRRHGIRAGKNDVVGGRAHGRGPATVNRFTRNAVAKWRASLV